MDALDQAAVLVAMARWIVDANIDILLGPEVDPHPVSTPTRCPVIRVAHATESSYLVGGVALTPALMHITDSASRSKELTALAMAARPARSGSWVFRDGPVVLSALALPAAVRDPEYLPGIYVAPDQRSVANLTSDWNRQAFGNVSIANTASETLRIEINGPTNHLVNVPATRKMVIMLPPASYRLTVHSSCGSRSSSLTIAHTSAVELRYGCVLKGDRQ